MKYYRFSYLSIDDKEKLIISPLLDIIIAQIFDQFSQI